MLQRLVNHVASLRNKLAHDEFNPVPYRQLFCNTKVYWLLLAMLLWNCFSDFLYINFGINILLYAIDVAINLSIFFLTLRVNPLSKKFYPIIYVGMNLLFAIILTFAKGTPSLLFIMLLDALVNTCLIFVCYRDTGSSDFVPVLPRLLGTYTKTTKNLNVSLKAEGEDSVPVEQIQNEARAAVRIQELKEKARQGTVTEEDVKAAIPVLKASPRTAGVADKLTESDSDINSLSHLIDLE